MARYLVGEDGFLKKRWGFLQALEAAGEGDIIELEEGFSPFYEQNNNPVTITRSITIEGHPDHNGALTNIIDGVVIRNGAVVTLKNLEVRKAVDKRNNINVKDGAVLTAENVVLTSYAGEGENYPVVYISNGAEVSFVSSAVEPGNLHDGNYQVYAENSTLEIIHSTVHARVQVSDSKLDIHDSEIRYPEKYVLFANKNSVITISSSTLEGGCRVDEKTSWPCIMLTDSKLTATDMLVKQPGDKNNAVIHMVNGAEACLINSVIAPGNPHDRNYKVYVENSALEIVDSAIHAVVWVSGSKLNIRNSEIRYLKNCALYANKNSVITLSSSVLEGGDKTDKGSWSCVKLVDSELTATDIVVKQPEYDRALYAVNSRLTLDLSRYDSLCMEKSEASIGHICVAESFFIQDCSHVKAEGICIVGRDNGKVNLYLNKKSSLEADLVCFGKLTQPNTKAERDTTINVETMIQAAYNPENWEFILDEQGAVKETGDASEIEYFGELTAFERLNQMVGIAGVKQTVEEFVAIAEMNKKREKQGLKNSAFSLHSLFLGNPGTGKTTVARLLGEILYEKGIISSDKFVETSRSNLVAEYLGQTAVKTRGVLESALGGVLFIDEAYTLCGGKNDNYKDYGTEAVEEILKFMEDHRQDIVLIFAGYTHRMEQFLAINEGLKSRIPNTFLFEDYTQAELVRIGLDHLQEQKYEIDEKAYTDLVYKKYSESNDNSNGRWVRNLNEKLIRKMAIRVSKDPNASLVLITQEDIDAV